MRIGNIIITVTFNDDSDDWTDDGIAEQATFGLLPHTNDENGELVNATKLQLVILSNVERTASAENWIKAAKMLSHELGVSLPAGKPIK